MNVLSILKSRAVFFVAALAVGMSTTTMHAQDATERVQFVSPFAFTCGTQHLTAGRYTVSRVNARVMLVQGDAKSVMAMTQTTHESERTGKGKIVFHKAGGQFFLSQVWAPGKSVHLDLNPTGEEKKMLVAMNGTALETVEVALLEMPR